MKTVSRPALVAAVVFLAAQPETPRAQSLIPLAASHFDDPAVFGDGWQGTNTLGGRETLTHHVGGATPESVGYVSVSESGGDSALMYFTAPPRFLGDMRSAYHGRLSLQVKQSSTGNQLGAANFVRLARGDVLLSFSLRSVPPSESWAHYEVPIRADVGWIHVSSNRVATPDDFAFVLKSLDRLEIKAEYSHNNSDRTDLDNVVLWGHPPGPVQPSLSAANYAGIRIEGIVGAGYRVEYREALEPADAWRTLADVVLPSNPYLFVDQQSSGVLQRFYRAVLNE